VRIARALVNSPSVIFADEPTGNLDSVSGKQVMDIFPEIEQEGHTIILVTHESVTAQNAEKIVRIRDGLIGRHEMVTNRWELTGIIINNYSAMQRILKFIKISLTSLMENKTRSF